MKQPAITPVQTTEIPDILPVQECSCSPGEDLHRPEDLLALNIDRIRLRGQRRVLWQRHLWKQTAQVPAQGLAIPHEEADIVCLGLDNREDEARFYRQDPAASHLTKCITGLERTLAEMQDSPLAQLAGIFGLLPEEMDMLLLCAAPEVEPRLRRLYGYLHDDASWCAPTPWLGQVIFRWDSSLCLTASSPLIRWMLAYPGLSEEQPWSSMARWMIDPRIVGYLMGNVDLPPSLQPLARWIEAEEEMAYEPNAVQQLRKLLRRRQPQEKTQLIQLVGPEGIGRKAWAARICAEQGMRMLCLDAPRLLTVSGKEGTRVMDAAAREKLIRAEREALLRSSALYWDGADRVPAEVWEEGPWRAPLKIFGVGQTVRLPASIPHAEVLHFPLPTPLQAEALWSHILPQGEELGAAALAERFTLTPAEIKAVAGRAAEGREELWEACRSFSHGRLGRMATILPCPYTWEDIVLAPKTAAHLKEIAAQAANRVTVYERWGFGRKRPLGRGVSALFAGPSGTGKTMAAQVMAAEMGVALFRIDLAGVVSKYVGETEKNLRQIFDEAERLNAVLFFDEADALFGKRTEVKDAHDRYANIEINYLLQRMESYEGLAILATNRKGDIDTAFLRRLRFIVDFPLPGIRERAAIWRLALPQRAPDGTELLEGIDWQVLAARLEISGAGIKDVALGAAFLACFGGEKIGMRHLAKAAKRELAKQGRLMGKDELGEIDAAESSEEVALTLR